jgi:hypothetical protein
MAFPPQELSQKQSRIPLCQRMATDLSKAIVEAAAAQFDKDTKDCIKYKLKLKGKNTDTDGRLQRLQPPEFEATIYSPAKGITVIEYEGTCLRAADNRSREEIIQVMFSYIDKKLQKSGKSGWMA